MTAKLLPARLFLIACLLASFLSACSGEQSTPPPAESEPAETLSAPTGEPVNVTPELDTADAVYALVPQKGGEIRLTLANGLAFTLTIPEGALMSDQEVTMTPIRQIEGLPLSGGLVAGVQLEPDGTLFMKPVTLTIHVPAGYDETAGRMVGFGYHGQGEGFYMTPADGDGQTITLQFLSFSGHGAATGTQADIDAQASHGTTTWYEDYRQRQAQGTKTESEQRMEDFR
ncbi:MAG TPA: hypothetical protein VFF68_11815, partial [Anaerolineaceae bacterium]|nr:hypothetical protein [Anaerolineaceae bacterium]